MLLRAGLGVRTIVSIDAFPLSPVRLTVAELQPKLGFLAQGEPPPFMVSAKMLGQSSRLTKGHQAKRAATAPTAPTSPSPGTTVAITAITTTTTDVTTAVTTITTATPITVAAAIAAAPATAKEGPNFVVFDSVDIHLTTVAEVATFASGSRTRATSNVYA